MSTGGKRWPPVFFPASGCQDKTSTVSTVTWKCKKVKRLQILMSLPINNKNWRVYRCLWFLVWNDNKMSGNSVTASRSVIPSFNQLLKLQLGRESYCKTVDVSKPPVIPQSLVSLLEASTSLRHLPFSLYRENSYCSRQGSSMDPIT